MRRTAAGRCCSLMWWWTTASQHGCTRSPWKRNTWTHSPPLLESQIKNVGRVRKTQNVCKLPKTDVVSSHFNGDVSPVFPSVFVKDLNKNAAQSLTQITFNPQFSHWRVHSLDITVNTSSFLDYLNDSLKSPQMPAVLAKLRKYLKGKQQWQIGDPRDHGLSKYWHL